jgi:lysine-specific demethylase 8
MAVYSLTLIRSGLPTAITKLHIDALTYAAAVHECNIMNDETNLVTLALSDNCKLQSPKRKFSSTQRELIDIWISNFCSLQRYILLLATSGTKGAAARKLDPLWRCGDAVITLLHRQCEIIRDQSGDYELAIKRCNDMMEIAHDKFYAFPFKDVPACWMELYREASLLKFTAIALLGVWGLEDRSSNNTPPLTESQLDEMVQTMDMALIMTGPPRDPAKRESIEAAMALLEKCHVESLKSGNQKNGQPATKRRKVESLGDDSYNSLALLSAMGASIPDPPIKQTNGVTRSIELSLGAFSGHVNHPREPDLGPEPLIINGALTDWPAVINRSWNDPEYLMAKTIGGRRLVPIETGKSYVDAGFGQKIVKFKEFMDEYILKPKRSTEPGYLAQHDLFSQIPSMRDDILIPDYCFIAAPGPHPSSPFAEAHSKLPSLEEPLLNAWFGPAGTTTPLHTDPYHNILAQVVGRKYVRLYAPRESKNLYARGIEDGIDMSNTSELDVGILTGLDGKRQDAATAAEKFPLAKSAKYVECILEEGECLYIPIGWWHYVRSLSVSFSVSFWFN